MKILTPEAIIEEVAGEIRGYGNMEFYDSNGDSCEAIESEVIERGQAILWEVYTKFSNPDSTLDEVGACPGLDGEIILSFSHGEKYAMIEVCPLSRKEACYLVLGYDIPMSSDRYKEPLGIGLNDRRLTVDKAVDFLLSA